jgi:hypothetical protein
MVRVSCRDVVRIGHGVVGPRCKDRRLPFSAKSGSANIQCIKVVLSVCTAASSNSMYASRNTECPTVTQLIIIPYKLR